MNPQYIPYITLTGVVLAMIGFIYGVQKDRRTQQEKQKESREEFEKEIRGALRAIEKDLRDVLKTIEKELRDLHNPLEFRLIKIETRLEPFWQKMSTAMGNVLHSPHPENARMDYLIEQFQAERITLDEMKELIGRLKAMKDDRHDESPKQMAAAFMLLGIEQQQDRELFRRALAEVGH